MPIKLLYLSPSPTHTVTLTSVSRISILSLYIYMKIFPANHSQPTTPNSPYTTKKVSMKAGHPFLHLCFILALLSGFAIPDPDPLQDYCVADKTKSWPSFYINGVPCINPDQATSSDFTTSVLSKPGNTEGNIFGFNVTLTSVANLPGLNTMGLSMARVDLAPYGLLPPHSHPKASEVTICLRGRILVGFVDTSLRLFAQALLPGETFVFPKGLIHFLFNLDGRSPALAVSGLSSQNPGAQVAPLTLFRSQPSIIDEILTKAFQITGEEISRIRKKLGG